uniref:Uncharacterized protein n=1 Tax=Arundo donax TaxID=35708 RepID=A0A0A9HG43_ARUDO
MLQCDLYRCVPLTAWCLVQLSICQRCHIYMVNVSEIGYHMSRTE